MLEPAEPRIALPNKVRLEEMIGLNIASDYGSRGKLGSYRDMIKLVADCVEDIQDTTGRSVLLVPHIVAYPEHIVGNDTIFLRLVQECLAERGLDVALLPSSLRSWELKWVLGKLYAYIGSRMHSTVSSLGSGTPTLSIAFSEKGLAINELLFGHTRFAFQCNELTVQKLREKLTELLSEADTVRDHLSRRIPQIQEMSRKAGEYLNELLG